MAWAQGYPVIDQAAITQAIDNVNAAGQQIQQLDAMLTQVKSVVQTVGKEGLPTLLFQTALNQSGISQFGPPVADLLATVDVTWGAGQTAVASGQQTTNTFKDVLSQIDALKKQAGVQSAPPDFSSFSSTQTWVKNELTVAKGANLTTINLTRKARAMLAGEAAANAYAMALNARQQIATMAGRAQQLAQQAASANDLRGDLAANTAVMLAMHDEMAQVQALMAGLLEVQSSAHLAEADPTLSTTATTAGN